MYPSKFKKKDFLGCSVISSPGIYQVKSLIDVSEGDYAIEDSGVGRYAFLIAAIDSKDVENLKNLFVGKDEIDFEKLRGMLFCAKIWKFNKNVRLPVRNEMLQVTLDASFTTGGGVRFEVTNVEFTDIETSKEGAETFNSDGRTSEGIFHNDFERNFPRQSIISGTIAEKYYPQVRHPESFIEILKRKPLIPATPQEPIAPRKPIDSMINLGILDLMLIGTFILGIYLIQDDDTQRIGYLLLFIGIPSCFRILFALFESKPPEAKADYREKYIKMIAQHEAEKIRYQRLLAEYQNTVNTLNMPANIATYRANAFKMEFAINRYPENVSMKGPTRGISEDYFFDVLHEIYHDKVMCNQMVLLSGHYFYPDIVYFDRDKKLAIDIEIDEPYVGSTGQPIHVDGEDYWRDKGFSEVGWFVVRFAEEQVIRFPKECSAVIQKIINDFESQLIVNSYALKSLHVKTWFDEEAHKMAFLKYRNSYLPGHLQEKLKSETIVPLSGFEILMSRSTIEPSADDDLPF